MAAEGREKVAFVVLHYLSAELTQDCLESLLALGAGSEHFEPAVVVVDNASNNGSTEQVEARFGSCENVRFLRNEANLGFSRANNRGFQLAVEEFAPAHVVVLNNDTVIRQAGFLDELERIFEEQGRPHVIGPDIFVERKGIHQSPWMPAPMTRERIEARLENMRYLEAHGGVPRSLHGKIRHLMCRTAAGRRFFEQRDLKRLAAFEGWREPAEGSLLHGAAIVFTRAFVAEGLLPFVPETFLYEEEQILALRCQQRGWRTYYTPELQVIHYDDGSTDLATKDYDRKQRFLRKNEIESLQTLLAAWDTLEEM